MDVKSLREKSDKTQQELSDATGIPRDRIAKWEQGKGSPKLDDYNTLAKFFAKHIREEVPILDQTSTEQVTGQSLLNLIETHKILVESNKTLVDSNKELVDNNSALTKYLLATGNVPKEKSEADDARLSDLLELIVKIGSGKKLWASEQEGAAALSKRFFGKKRTGQAKDTQIG